MFAVQSSILACLWLPGLGYGVQLVTGGAAAQSSLDVKVVNGRLAFDTVAHYDSILADLGTEPREVLAQLRMLNHFTALAEIQKGLEDRDKAIDDDLFAALLNEDLVVQIGNTIFRVDPWVERVFALSDSHEAQYQDLVSGNTNNPNIRAFSTNQEVLAAYRNAGPPGGYLPLFGWLKKLFSGSGGCTEDPCGGTSAADSFVLHSVTCTTDVRYRKWGLWFTLFAELDYTHSSSGLFTPSITLEPVHFKRLCGSTTGPNNVTDHNENGTFHYVIFRAYLGSTRLSKLHMRAKFKLEDLTGAPEESGWYEIRKNL